MRSQAEQIVVGLGGKWDANKRRGWALCPIHETDGDHNPSLRVEDYDDKVLFICESQRCPNDLILRELKKRGLWRIPYREQTEEEKTRTALKIWNTGFDIRQSLAEKYLASRKLDGSNLPHAIRWQGQVPWPDRTRQECLVALYTDIVTGEPKAIECTALGRKMAGQPQARITYGPKKGCVIRLSPDEEVTEGLVIGEGLETVLTGRHCSLNGSLLWPGWACGSCEALGAFPVLSGIECLTILVEHDDAGIAAALRCKERWQAAGREVILWLSPVKGEDLNDYWRKKCR